MSLFACPTHGLHPGPICPAGNEIDKCAGPSGYVTLGPTPPGQDQFDLWHKVPYAHGPDFNAEWNRLRDGA
jgi:hypothetical protein